MSVYLKACGAVLIGVILILIIGKNSKDLALVLAATVCVMVALTAMEYIRPVLEFLTKLEDLGNLDHSMIRILLKVAGIGLITEICSLVCADSGNTSVGKVMKLLGGSVMIWLSLPLYTILIELLQRILGAL